MTEWTAADISNYDQYLAGADAELDRLVAMLQIGTAEVGEHQAMASVGLFLSMREKTALQGLLTTALRRLAVPGEDKDSSEEQGQ